MFDLGKKVKVTNELCAAISCIAYPSLIEANRPSTDKQGIRLPSSLIRKVTFGSSRSEYFVRQEIVDEIRKNITEVAVAIYLAYDRFDVKNNRDLDLSLLSKAVSNIDIAAETRWTEGHVKFGIRHLETKEDRPVDNATVSSNPKPIPSGTSRGANKNKSTLIELDTGIHKCGNKSIPAHPFIPIVEVVEFIKQSAPVNDRKSDLGIQDLQNALPSNDEAYKVIKRFEELLDLGYGIEVFLRDGHVLVKSFDPKQNNKPLGQVFIDSSSGLVTSEY